MTAHSYSSLSTFKQCPLRYYHQYVAKTYERVESPAMKEGLRVHKAFENYIMDRENLPEDLRRHAPVLDALPKGTRAEIRMAVDRNWNPEHFFDHEAWFRGVIDVYACLGEKQAFILDRKTGRRRRDNTQLRFNAALVFALRCDISAIAVSYSWTKSSELDSWVIERDQYEDIKGEIGELARGAELARETLRYEGRPSRLCPWCDHFKKCEYA